MKAVNLKQHIKGQIEVIYSEVNQIYKHLHQNPELSFQEKETAAFICNFLEKENIPYRSGIGGYGILATIKGKDPAVRVIALRADMDALPIQEENNIPYCSKKAGVMHACGHDTHTASLLGVAKILNAMKSGFSGTVLLIFQPGEEKHPGGARLMLEDNIFAEYDPEIIIAQHAFMDLPAGTVGFRAGTVMASADEIHLVIKGKGGHAAMPHLLNDTVLAGAQVIVSMQQVVSRLSNPFYPLVLSFGKFIANGATNIIPDEIFISGTLRSMNEKEREKAKVAVRRIAVSTAEAYGCECHIDVKDGYPTVYNNEKVTEKAIHYSEEYLGKENVLPYPVRMTSEDFVFFSQKYPCIFYRFGVKSERNKMNGSLHTSSFLIEEEALKTAVGNMAYLAIRFLEKE
ncbi:MAG: M20 family metallopeptidase [Candidatus Azobacteroides sp.]|nr:M20 family metallopeptidase [Candidatus Azobacteroides sp.]